MGKKLDTILTVEEGGQGTPEPHWEVYVRYWTPLETDFVAVKRRDVGKIIREYDGTWHFYPATIHFPLTLEVISELSAVMARFKKGEDGPS